MRKMYKFEVMYGDANGFEDGSIEASTEKEINFFEAFFKTFDTEFVRYSDGFDSVSKENKPEFISKAMVIIKTFREMLEENSELRKEMDLDINLDLLDENSSLAAITNALSTVTNFFSEETGISFYSEYLGYGGIDSYESKELDNNDLVLSAEEAELRLSKLLGVKVVIK